VLGKSHWVRKSSLRKSFHQSNVTKIPQRGHRLGMPVTTFKFAAFLNVFIAVGQTLDSAPNTMYLF
jgi:hypothetical protein